MEDMTESIMDSMTEIIGIVAIAFICAVVAYKLGAEGSEIIASGLGGLAGYLTKSLKDKVK